MQLASMPCSLENSMAMASILAVMHWHYSDRLAAVVHEWPACWVWVLSLTLVGC